MENIPLIRIALRGFNDHYDKIEGETVFAQRVNAMLSDYWVKTGGNMPVMDACISVLAAKYNELSSS